MSFHLFLNDHIHDHSSLDESWEGAVVFLYNQKDVFLIRRSVDVPTHRDQIAFFGGHRNSNEKTPLEVAARELVEESGLDLSIVQFNGCLQKVQTKTGSWIVPVLAFTTLSSEDLLEKVEMNREWSTMMAYPLESLLNLQKWGFAERYVENRRELIYFLHLDAREIKFKAFDSRDQLLWGVTAKIIKQAIDLYLNRLSIKK